MPLLNIALHLPDALLSELLDASCVVGQRPERFAAETIETRLAEIRLDRSCERTTTGRITAPRMPECKETEGK
jgi:hypothetical protein